MRSFALSALLLLISLSQILAQEEPEENNKFGVLHFHAGYGIDWSALDMADRFGRNFQLGADLDYTTPASSVIIGLTGRFLFGDQVREDPVAFLRSAEGLVASPAGVNVPLFLRMRGGYYGAHVGKLFSLSGGDKRNSIRATLGLGLLQHKIRLLDDSQSLELAEQPYIKAIDRLSNGLALRHQLGYQKIDPEGFLHFYIALEVTLASTASRRDYDLQLMQRDDRKRTDMLIGIRAAWSLPLYYTSDVERTYYY